MDDLQALNSSLSKLQALSGGNKKTKKALGKDRVLAIIASEYGYSAYLDAKHNRMTAKELMFLLEQITRKKHENLINMATACRVAQADKNQFNKIIKEWNKKAI